MVLNSLNSHWAIVEEVVGHVCTPLIEITYFYLEFHVSLNSCNIKPAKLEFSGAR